MTFYTASETPRPIRLSEPTRRFAYDSLHHRYGLDTRKVPAVSLDSVEGIETMTDLDRYDAAIRAIARQRWGWRSTMPSLPRSAENLPVTASAT